jgi:hypothetical protein
VTIGSAFSAKLLHADMGISNNPKHNRLTTRCMDPPCLISTERNLIIERVRAGLRRARLEGRTLGRKPIEIDRVGLLRDRIRGLSLAQLAKAYKISRTSVARALKQSEAVIPKTTLPLAPTDIENFA